MTLPPYPTYKPSGVDWLGEVPDHWEALPLKRRHRIVNGGTPSSSEESYWNGGVNWITPEDLGTNDGKRIGASRRTLSHEGLLNCGAQLVPRDSIVISTRAPIGHVTVTEKESSTNQGCRGLIPENAVVCADYIYYSLFASHRVLQAAGKGTTFLELSAGLLGSHSVPFPPRDEQTTIADFLDGETAKIDTLVAKKRTLIKRLKEKRIALISRTVTRGLPPDAARQAGLDPHPKLKPSGIDGIGDVPQEWEILPFTKYVADRSDYRGRTPEKTEDGIFLVTAKNVRMGYIDYDSSQEYVAEADYDDIMRRGLPKIGDILFTTEAPLGNVATVDREDIALAQRIIRFRMNSRYFDTSFILYGLIADHFQIQLQCLSTGSTAEGLKASKLPILRVVAPPLKEQSIIARFLDRETAKIDALTAKVEQAIDRLQEYRTALITAAVTGKIDVRGAVAHQEDAA